MKMLGTRPRKPRRFFGAISPRNIGTTLSEIPNEVKKERKLFPNITVKIFLTSYAVEFVRLFCFYDV